MALIERCLLDLMLDPIQLLDIGERLIGFAGLALRLQLLCLDELAPGMAPAAEANEAVGISRRLIAFVPIHHQCRRLLGG